jgi:peptidoglycan/xylan/chitin deacetylase (PgdA/CDA1 family)
MTGTCLAVMYHYVRDSGATDFPGIRALSPSQFSAQLDWLQSRYTIVGVDMVEAALAGGEALPANAAMLTFDDGFVDHYEAVFPELARRRLSGVFFISQVACSPSPRLLSVHKAQFLLARLGAEAFGRAVLSECGVVSAAPQAGRRSVFGADRWEAADDRAVKQLINYELPFDEAERILGLLFERHLGSSAALAERLYLNEPMVRAMAAQGMVFGYHTRTHRMLSRLTADEQRDELAPGVEWLRDLTGQRSVPFCYPWGGVQTYTQETVRLLDTLGYSLAFNTERRQLDVSVDARFELPRLDTRDLPPYADAEAITAAGTDEA